MTCRSLTEKIEQPDFPVGYYDAHVPAPGLTAHGLRIAGAREAAIDLIKFWIAGKKANGEMFSSSLQVSHSAMDIDDAVWSPGSVGQVAAREF